jgi:DNA-binding CsgD family transcriptional regulator
MNKISGKIVFDQAQPALSIRRGMQHESDPTTRFAELLTGITALATLNNLFLDALVESLRSLLTDTQLEQPGMFCLTYEDDKHQNHNREEKHLQVQFLALAPEVQRNFQTATQFCDVAISLREASHPVRSPDVIQANGRMVQEKLRENSSNNESATSRTSLENVTVYARAQPSPSHPAILSPLGMGHLPLLSERGAAKHKYGRLTARECEVAGKIARGKSNKEIAAELFVGRKTVEAHVTHILHKLSFTSRAQIAAWAVAKGLTEAPADLY